MPFSGWSSSGVVACAVPISEPAGQLLAAKSGRVQIVPMWALSSSSPFGSVTWTTRLFASPGCWVKTAWIAGMAEPFQTPPVSFRLSLGSYGRSAQLVAW